MIPGFEARDANLISKSTKRRAILTKEQVISIYRIKLDSNQQPSNKGARATAIAYTFGVSEKAVRDIWSRRTWLSETQTLEMEDRLSSSESSEAPPSIINDSDYVEIKPESNINSPLTEQVSLTCWENRTMNISEDITSDQDLNPTPFIGDASRSASLSGPQEPQWLFEALEDSGVEQMLTGQFHGEDPFPNDRQYGYSFYSCS